jgi:hypothetical protein
MSKIASMEIDLVFFHGQLRGLGKPAAGEIGLIVLEKGVTGQLAHLHFPPGAAVITAGLIPAARTP